MMCRSDSLIWSVGKYIFIKRIISVVSSSGLSVMFYNSSQTCACAAENTSLPSIADSTSLYLPEPALSSSIFFSLFHQPPLSFPTGTIPLIPLGVVCVHV